MSFGVYVHIPYCLQKCHYCDFATFDLQHRISPQEYVSLLESEIKQRADLLPYRTLSSIYFGGGTPSLLPAEDIHRLTRALAQAGLEWSSDAELTIEINPGTLSAEKLDVYLAAGINRFSVGVQTFNSAHLKTCRREHSAEDSVATLKLLNQRGVNYSFDLLFGLPHQTLADLNKDLDRLLEFSPPHVSLYNLTVPRKHFMNMHRPTDDVQAEMFDLIDLRLAEIGVRRYEISNFSRAGFESRHNSLYWCGADYWGFGVSSHSFVKNISPWGTRFWNPFSATDWKKQVLASKKWPQWEGSLPPRQYEHLRQHEALTDFFHTHLRHHTGFSLDQAARRFSSDAMLLARPRLEKLLAQGFLQKKNQVFSMTSAGQKLANQVFLEMTFIEGDLGAGAN